MKKWNELSMFERLPYLKLGIESGIYDSSVIADVYNSYDFGGWLKNTIETLKKPIIDNTKKNPKKYCI